jgi:ribosomal protein S2
MKIYKKRLNTGALTTKFLNVGRPSRERNKDNLDTIIATPSKQDHINLESSYQNLKNSLLSVSNIISSGGKVLVYHKHGKEVARPLRHLFLKCWPKGLISNFKNIGRNHKVFPNLVVIASDDKEEQEMIANETNRCKIGSVFVTNSNVKRYGLITIPGNTSSDVAVDSLVDLFKRAVTLGLIKEVSKIDPRRLRKYKGVKRLKLFKYEQKQSIQNKKLTTNFPRLESNQRPRT